MEAIRKIVSVFREKAKSKRPELVELIKSERQGGLMFLKEQHLRSGDRLLFEGPDSATPERVLAKKRKFQDLIVVEPSGMPKSKKTKFGDLVKGAE